MTKRILRFESEIMGNIPVGINLNDFHQLLASAMGTAAFDADSYLSSNEERWAVIVGVTIQLERVDGSAEGNHG